MKFNLKLNMKTVSMLEFRRRAGKILSGLQRAKQTVRLTYRGKPVADLVPVASTKSRRPPQNDPFYHLAELAAAEGDDLTNQQIDRILYGEA